MSYLCFSMPFRVHQQPKYRHRSRSTIALLLCILAVSQCDASRRRRRAKHRLIAHVLRCSLCNSKSAPALWASQATSPHERLLERMIALQRNRQTILRLENEHQGRQTTVLSTIIASCTRVISDFIRPKLRHRSRLVIAPLLYARSLHNCAALSIRAYV
jgi:hypothetical protein